VPCPAHPKVVCVYIAPECSNSLHDNTNLDAADLDSVVLLVFRLLVLHLLLWLVLLLLTAVLHLLLLARVATRHRVRSSVVRLAVLCVLRLVLVAVVKVRHLRRSVAGWLQLDVHATLVLLSVILQSEFAADLLNARLDLLHVVHGMVSLADDHVEVRLAVLLGVANALLKNLLGFFDELAVQVDSVAGDFAHGIVLTENELRGLLVVFVGFGGMRLALLRQLARPAAIAALVGLLGLRGEMLVLTLLFTSEIAEAVVLLLRITTWSVIEGWSASRQSVSPADLDCLCEAYHVLRVAHCGVTCSETSVWISECGRNIGYTKRMRSNVKYGYANGLFQLVRARA
jgi:uncharacterized membrane protein YedE/YeeE